MSRCLGIGLFGLDRGTSIGQFKPLYQQCADLFLAPKGRPDFPVQPVVPIPPVEPDMAFQKFVFDDPSKGLKEQRSFIKFCNDSGAIIGQQIGKPVDDGSPTKFSSAGQQVNQIYDHWDAVQQKAGNGAATIPSSNDMCQLCVNVLVHGLTGDVVDAALQYETPLVTLQRS